jgi:hypothetical protein
MLRKLSPDMWLSVGYELQTEEAVPPTCSYLPGMSSMLRKLFPDMWTSADTYLRKLSPNVCGYLSGISSKLRKLSPHMWLSAC